MDAGNDGKGELKDEFEMSPPTQQELSSRQWDTNREPRVEIWFENINVEVIYVQIEFNTIGIGEIRIGGEVRRVKRRGPRERRSQERRVSKERLIRKEISTHDVPEAP